MNIKRVKKGSHLHWPENVASGEKRYRGGEGYCVDMDAPLEVEWCKGQEYKLEDAPEGSAPDALTLPHAIGLRRQAEDKAAGIDRDKAKADAAGIMDPAPIPGKQPAKVGAKG